MRQAIHPPAQSNDIQARVFCIETVEYQMANNTVLSMTQCSSTPRQITLMPDCQYHLSNFCIGSLYVVLTLYLTLAT